MEVHPSHMSMSEGQRLEATRELTSAECGGVSATEKVVDVEAARSKNGSTTGETGIKEEAKTPLGLAKDDGTTGDQSELTSSLIDNLRIIALTLILLQTAALLTVATHLHAMSLSSLRTYAFNFAFLNLVVGHTRVIAVPLLFLCAGAQAQMAITQEEKGVSHYVKDRRWRTGIFVLGYEAAVFLVGCVYELPKFDPQPGWRDVVSYAVRREGMEALMNGPVAYALVVFVLDCAYTFFLYVRARGKHGRKEEAGQIITTQRRYDIAKTVRIALQALSVYACGAGYVRLPTPLRMNAFERQVFTLLATEHHLLPIYIGAYATGTQLVDSIPFLLASLSRAHGKSTQRPSLATSLFLSFIGLTIIRYIFPTVATFLDMREPPMPHLLGPTASAAYAIWLIYLLAAVPKAQVGLLYGMRKAPRRAMRARYVCCAVYMQCLLVARTREVYAKQNGQLVCAWVMMIIPSVCFVCFVKIGTELCKGPPLNVDVEAWWNWIS